MIQSRSFILQIYIELKCEGESKDECIEQEKCYRENYFSKKENTVS